MNFLKNSIKEYQFPITVFLFSTILIIFLIHLSIVLGFKDSLDKGNLLSYLQRSDTGWYKDISENGYKDIYDYTNHANLVFFPLYPSILYIFNYAIKDFNIAAFIINEISLFFALIFLYKLLTIYKLKENIIKSTILFTFFSPFSFFLYTYYTESIFLLFVCLAFILLEKKKYFYASLVIGISTALRSPALVLVPVYITFILFENVDIKLTLRESLTKLNLKKELLYTPICILGILIFIFYLKFKFNDPFGFLLYERSWGKSSINPLHILEQIKFVLFDYWYQTFIQSSWPELQFKNALHLLNNIFLLLPLTCVPWIYKRFNKSYTLFIIVYVLTVLYKSNIEGDSNGRYAIILFPFFIFLATIGEKYKISSYILIIFSILFSLLFFLSMHGYNIW